MNAIVHAHTPAVIPFGVSAVRLQPVFHMGAFLGGGVPVFEIRDAGGTATDMLVSTQPLGDALARTLGTANVALMRGHGMVAVGSRSPKRSFARTTPARTRAAIRGAAPGQPDVSERRRGPPRDADAGRPGVARLGSLEAGGEPALARRPETTYAPRAASERSAKQRCVDDPSRLMERVGAGDIAAFESLYDAYHRLVYGIALKVLAAEPAAEDVTQTVFMKVWTSAPDFRSGNFVGWIARVTRNRAIDVLRSGGRTADLPPHRRSTRRWTRRSCCGSTRRGRAR